MYNKRDRVFDLSIQTFLHSAGAATPTPGGGSVAALVGSLGASMASMSANFTKGEKFSLYSEQVDQALKSIQQTCRNCEDLLEADIVSFDRYMDAMKLPKETEEQKEIRKQAIQNASVEAITIPYRLMEVCLEAMHITQALAPIANKNIISDLGISVILFEAAAQSAWLTVEINRVSLKDPVLRNEYEHKCNAIISEITGIKNHTVKLVRQRIAQ